MTPYRIRWVAALALVAGGISLQALAQPGATGGEWRSLAADTFGSKYSAVDQISAENFTDLEIAWQWHTADSHLIYESEYGTSLVPAQTLFDLLEAEEPGRWVTPPTFRRLVATPLMVDGVLYATAGSRRDVVSLDAATGELLWMHRLDEAESG